MGADTEPPTHPDVPRADLAEHQPDGRRAAEVPLLSRVQNCASVGKYSGIRRLGILARQCAVR